MLLSALVADGQLSTEVSWTLGMGQLESPQLSPGAQRTAASSQVAPIPADGGT